MKDAKISCIKQFTYLPFIAQFSEKSLSHCHVKKARRANLTCLQPDFAYNSGRIISAHFPSLATPEPIAVRTALKEVARDKSRSPRAAAATR